MRKKNKVLAIIAAASLLSGCASTGEVEAVDSHMAMEEKSEELSGISSEEATPSVEASDEVASEATTESTSGSLEAESSVDGRKLSTDEIKDIQLKLNQWPYKPFLMYGFADPTDVDWDVVLYEEYGMGSDIDYDGPVFDEYLKAVGKEKEDLDDVFYEHCIKELKTEDLEKFVKDITGTEYKDAKHPLTWTYLESMDAYYREIADIDTTEYIFASATVKDNIYTVETTDLDGYSEPRTFVFLMDGDDIKVVSNTIHWEYGADKTFEFDSDIYGKTTIYVHESEKSGCGIRVVSDGNMRHGLSLPWSDVEFMSIDEYVFLDMNADGKKDVCAIGNTPEGKYIHIDYSEMVKGDNSKMFWEYSDGDAVLDLDTAFNQGVGGVFTEEAIRSFVLKNGKEGPYDSYQEAYLQSAFFSHLMDKEWHFGLQDLDGDKSPELIVDRTDSGVIELYIYSFEDGYAINKNYYKFYDEKKTSLGDYNNIPVSDIDTSMTYDAFEKLLK